MRPSKSEKLRVLVTGATGPYGAHFAKLCLDRGYEVFSIEHTRRPNDSAVLLGVKDRITWASGDIRDSAFLAHLLAAWEVQMVAHFAALPLVRTGTLVAEPVFAINAGGTVALLDAVKQQVQGGRRVHFLQVSTDKVYGDAGDRPYVEDMPLGGSGIYEASKVAAEAACRAYQAQGLVPDLVVSRSCNILAEGDTHWRLVPNTIRQFLCNVPAKVWPKNQFVREFISVHDAVEAQLGLMLRADEYRGQAFNIGSGSQYTQEEMVEHVRANHFPDGHVLRVDPPTFSDRAEIRFQVLDSAKIRRALGWAPKRTVPEAIAELVAWWREHRDLAAWSML